MDRATLILGLTAVAVARKCHPSEALRIARDVAGDRQHVDESDLDGLVAETFARADQAIWGGVSI